LVRQTVRIVALVPAHIVALVPAHMPVLVGP